MTIIFGPMKELPREHPEDSVSRAESEDGSLWYWVANSIVVDGIPSYCVSGLTTYSQPMLMFRNSDLTRDGEPSSDDAMRWTAQPVDIDEYLESGRLSLVRDWDGVNRDPRYV